MSGIVGWSPVNKCPDFILWEPLFWKRPLWVFVCPTSDLFHPDVPDEHLDHVFAIMAMCLRHDFQVFTDHPAQVRAYIKDDLATPCRIRGVIEESYDGDARICSDQGWPLPNVFISFNGHAL